MYRSQSGMLPTIYGKIVATCSKNIRDELDTALHQIKLIQSKIEPSDLRLGISANCDSQYLISKIINSFDLKKCLIYFIEDDTRVLSDMFVNDVIDAVIAPQDEFSEIFGCTDYIADLIYEEFAIIAVAKNFLDVSISLVELKNFHSFPWILPRKSNILRSWFDNRCLNLGIPMIKPVIEYTRAESAREAVLSGAGLCLMMHYCIKQDIEDRKTIVLEIPEFKMKRKTSVFYKQSFNSPSNLYDLIQRFRLP
jgi:DNA-binding transcriptional LysR family regulator